MATVTCHRLAPQGVENVPTLCVGKSQSNGRYNNISFSKCVKVVSREVSQSSGLINHLPGKAKILPPDFLVVSPIIRLTRRKRASELATLLWLFRSLRARKPHHQHDRWMKYTHMKHYIGSLVQFHWT